MWKVTIDNTLSFNIYEVNVLTHEKVLAIEVVEKRENKLEFQAVLR